MGTTISHDSDEGKQGKMGKNGEKLRKTGKNSQQHPLLLLLELSKPQIVTLQHHPALPELHLCSWAHPSSRARRGNRSQLPGTKQGQANANIPAEPFVLPLLGVFILQPSSVCPQTSLGAIFVQYLLGYWICGCRVSID